MNSIKIKLAVTLLAIAYFSYSFVYNAMEGPDGAGTILIYFSVLPFFVYSALRLRKQLKLTTEDLVRKSALEKEAHVKASSATLPVSIIGWCLMLLLITQANVDTEIAMGLGTFFTTATYFVMLFYYNYNTQRVNQQA